MSVSFLQLGISYFFVTRVLRARSFFYLALWRKRWEGAGRGGCKGIRHLFALYEGCNRAKSQSKDGSQVFFEVTENYEYEVSLTIDDSPICNTGRINIPRCMRCQGTSLPLKLAWSHWLLSGH